MGCNLSDVIDECRIFDVNFKERKLNYTYESNYAREERLRQELIASLQSVINLTEELYRQDNLFQEYVGRALKAIIYKVKN